MVIDVYQKKEHQEQDEPYPIEFFFHSFFGC